MSVDSAQRPPKVFLSYSHDSLAHSSRVLALADRLRDDGIDAALDQYEVGPPESWPGWMERHLRESDYVLVVCTETYLRRARGDEEAGRGHGVRWESHLTRQQLYTAGTRNTRFIPVLLDGGELAHIPDPLQGYTYYRLEQPWRLDQPGGYEQLYRHLTGQPRVAKRELGTLRSLPRRGQQSPKGGQPLAEPPGTERTTTQSGPLPAEQVSAPEEQLQQCVARIDAGSRYGSGFFVKPGVLVTCGHVIPPGQESARVFWRGQEVLADVVYRASEDKPDLAVLRLPEAASNWDHPAVNLGSEPPWKSSLFSFGHPEGEYHRGGDSVTFSYEGRSIRPSGEELLKLKGGQAQPGMSGAPVLDILRNSVCGVLTTTRDEFSDLGARAVSARFVQEVLRDLPQGGSIGGRHSAEDHTDFLLITPAKPLWDALTDLLPELRRLSPSAADDIICHRSEVSYARAHDEEDRYEVVLAPPLGYGVDNATEIVRRVIDKHRPRCVILLCFTEILPNRRARAGDIVLASELFAYELAERSQRKRLLLGSPIRVDVQLLTAAQGLRVEEWQRLVGVECSVPGSAQLWSEMIAGWHTRDDLTPKHLKALLQERASLFSVVREPGALRLVPAPPDGPRLLLIGAVTGSTDPDKRYAGQMAAAYTLQFLRSGPLYRADPQPHQLSDAGPTPKREADFQEAVSRYGIKAASLEIEITIENDGSSVVIYRLNGLETTKGKLAGLRFVFESTAGFVACPETAGDKRDQVSWESESEPRRKPLPLASKIESVRTLAGTFRFATPLERNDQISFAWQMRVLNGDALSDWEFQHLYGKKVQVHKDNTRIRNMEFSARTVWFPVERMTMRLTLPSRIESVPSLKLFSLDRHVLPPSNDVVRGSILQAYPRADSDWVRQNLKWKRDLKMEAIESASLRQVDRRTFVLEVSKPRVGTCYSLDWNLPESRLDLPLRKLELEAERIRARLIEHGKRRKAKEAGHPANAQVQDVFRRFDAEVRREYAVPDVDEKFEVCMMAYSREQRRLLIVEALCNGADMTPTQWDFQLPFGLGLAGACFREGRGVLAYVRPEDPENDDHGAEFYLPVEGSSDHEFLLALPLDHPDFTEPPGESAGPAWATRCRQLVGVICIGSTFSATKLRELQPEPHSPVPEALIRLRDRCQALCDAMIATLRQPGLGEANLAPGDAQGNPADESIW